MTNILEKALNSKDREVLSSAEAIAGVCRYPDNYWVMPDYYYPGIYITMLNKFHTSNDMILEELFFYKDTNGTFTYYDDNPENTDIFNISFEGDTVVLKNHNDEITRIPFPVLCGIFLKARELNTERPKCLDKAGPRYQPYKEKWFANQEKIRELQEKYVPLSEEDKEEKSI